jgi:hypothetical protein
MEFRAEAELTAPLKLLHDVVERQIGLALEAGVLVVSVTDVGRQHRRRAGHGYAVEEQLDEVGPDVGAAVVPGDGIELFTDGAFFEERAGWQGSDDPGGQLTLVVEVGQRAQVVFEDGGVLSGGDAEGVHHPQGGLESDP